MFKSEHCEQEEEEVSEVNFDCFLKKGLKCWANAGSRTVKDETVRRNDLHVFDFTGQLSRCWN